MSFGLPRMPLGLHPSRLFAISRLNQAQALVLARRSLLTSPSSREEHVSNQTVKMGTSEIRSPPLGQHKELDPYKGQSAIDKAVHIFFFTEILRGAKAITNKYSCGTNLLWCRDVDRVGEFLQTTVYYHVSIRKGTVVPPFSGRACFAQIPQWRREMHRSNSLISGKAWTNTASSLQIV
jgi:hypothetical protein